MTAYLAVELVADPPLLDSRAKVGLLVFRSFEQAGISTSDVVDDWTETDSVFAVPLADARLLPVLDHLATALRDIDDSAGDVQAKAALHMSPGAVSMEAPATKATPTGSPLAEARRLLYAPTLAAALTGAPSHTLAALVSQDFVDAVGIEDAELLTRFEQVPLEMGGPAWLRTIVPVLEHGLEILAVALTPDGRTAVTGHLDGTARRWDTATGQQIGEPIIRHNAAVLAVAVTPDGQQVISGDRAGIICRWRTATGQPIDHPSASGVAVQAIAVTPDDRWFISGSVDGRLRAWHTETGRRVRDGFQVQSGSVLAVQVTPDGRRIVSSDANGEIHWWNARTGEFVERREIGHRQGVHALALSPDGENLVSGGTDPTIRVWHLRTRELRTIEAGSTSVLALAVTPDSRQIISAHASGTLRRWDLATGEPIGNPLVGHEGRTNAVVVTPDGGQIISGGADGVLRRWDASTGEPIDSGGPPERLAEVVSDLESAEDWLGISGDVHTVATVLAALSTRPPLSVALLGDWGAGKSSFMRQLRTRMDQLSGSNARVGEQHAFATNLRQVTFNAWHYSDDHLWVGLIEHLFRELAARPTDEPDTGRINALEARLAGERAERNRLQHDLDAVQRIDDRRGWLGGVLAPVRSLPVFRAALRGIGRELRSGGWRIWLGIAILLTGVAVVVFGRGLLMWIGAAVALLGPAVSVWSRVGRSVDTARAQLLARKVELDNDIRVTKEELDELDPARRLDRLLAEITAEDRYASFRGLTGRIHHDLRRLSADLAAARERWERDGGITTPPLQRIVLYVDDLDRCTPERVVDVLQAVNLLLTMDLFMVVVAVDPRWLLRSLRSHHGELLTEPAKFGQGVGPVAYLDKIFHIPFALRPMGGHAVDFLHSLLPPEPESEPEPAQGVTPAASPAAATAAQPAEEPAAPSPVVQPSIVDKPMVSPAPASAVAEGLRVSAAEREFLGRLTPLLTTPRAIKKLTNLYRLLRLSVPHDELPAFLGGPYQAAALLLAALAGEPNKVRALLITLTASQPDRDIVDTLRATESALGTRLAELVLAIRKDIPVHADTATYRRWATEVARYGFETYDLYT